MKFEVHEKNITRARFSFNRVKNGGFTIIETLIALLVALLVLSIVLFSFSSFKNNSILQKSVAQAKYMLNEARSLSFASKSDLNYGIHLATNSITRFNGSTYSVSAQGNSVESIDTKFSITSISLNGGGSDVIFDKITGKTSNYGTFKIISSLDSRSSTTIRIYPSGLISEE